MNFLKVCLFFIGIFILLFLVLFLAFPSGIDFITMTLGWVLIVILAGFYFSTWTYVIVDQIEEEGSTPYLILAAVCTGILFYFIVVFVRDAYLKKGWKFLD